MKASLRSVTPLIPTGGSLADALGFYTKRMGFSILWEDGGMAGIERDGVSFNLVENDDPAWAGNASFSIGVAGLEALYEEYREIPARVGPLEMKAWGRREFHIVVPSGRLFAVLRRLGDRLRPPQMLSRTITGCLSLALLAAAPVSAAPFPSTPVETLAGRKLDVSRDIAPGFAVLIVGFTKASRARTAEWSRRLEPELLGASGAQAYQVAVLADVPRLVRGMVIGKIRGSVPEAMYPRFLLALEDAAAWKREADFADEDDAYLLVVRHGEVRWRGKGRLTEAGYQKLAEAVRSSAAAAPFDAGRLRTGKFVYRIRKGDREVARFTIGVARLKDGNVRFSGEATGFEQVWESIATRYFEPISASLRLRRSNGETFSMILAYARGRVKGVSATSDGKSRSAPVEKPVDAALPEGTVDQRIDWAAALSAPLETGSTFRFSVYDPGTGVSPVSASVGRAERVTVPAGTYETTRVVYRIEKAKGAESYEVLASRETPRLMVREDFPDGTVTELLEAPAAEPPSPQPSPAGRGGGSAEGSR